MKLYCIALFLLITHHFCAAKEKTGAGIPWKTYEAEAAKTNGTVMEASYEPYRAETESSGQQCVKLAATGQFVKFISSAAANSMVIRYSLPDGKDGKGTSATLGIYANGKLLQRKVITSRYAWLYGKYPFSNQPTDGKPRHFYDEVRIKGLPFAKGASVRVQWENNKDDNASYCMVDLIDLEMVAPPLKAPANSLLLTDTIFTGHNGGDDYTDAFQRCIAKAAETGKSVWIPVGTFVISGDIVIPANVTIAGSGMWYSILAGNEDQYGNSEKRVRLKGNGDNIHLSHFAIDGKLNYRNDTESNDGIVGSFGINSTITGIWIEHTKVGMWIENSKNLIIEGCRMRNTLADGINFCVGMEGSTIYNCTARGTGDDCFAMWPTTYTKQVFLPGHNRIVHCTAALPYLANGAAIYGGNSNAVIDCRFQDISQGSAILISTTFPTEDEKQGINNNFSGTTVVSGCHISTSGGFDHEWNWRAAVEICLDKRSIAGLQMNEVTINRSLSNGVSVIARTKDGESVSLTNAVLKNVHIAGVGIGVKGKQGLFISKEAKGSLKLVQSNMGKVKNEAGEFKITGKRKPGKNGSFLTL